MLMDAQSRTSKSNVKRNDEMETLRRKLQTEHFLMCGVHCGMVFTATVFKCVTLKCYFGIRM